MDDKFWQWVSSKETSTKPVVNSNEPKAETVNEKDEKNSNGNHTPV